LDVLFLIGRILFVLLFISSGVTAHILGREGGVKYARAAKAPAPEILVPLSGVAIIAGGLMVGFGVLADLGCILIAAFLIGITPIMHAYWKETNAQTRAIQQAMFMKNLALLGATIILFYALNQLQGDAGFVLTNPLFN
jgi:putative oxidoreductase